MKELDEKFYELTISEPCMHKLEEFGIGNSITMLSTSITPNHYDELIEDGVMDAIRESME